MFHMPWTADKFKIKNDGWINTVLQRSLPKKRKEKKKEKKKNYCWRGVFCSFSSWTSRWPVLSSTWAPFLSPGASLANNSSVLSEWTGWTKVWVGASILMLDKSRLGWEALTWRRQSSKPSANEPPSSAKRASESRCSCIASSFA